MVIRCGCLTHSPSTHVQYFVAHILSRFFGAQQSLTTEGVYRLVSFNAAKTGIL